MNVKQKFQELEALCQQRYDVIDHCYQTIQNAQTELQVLEIKYLKLQAKLHGVTLTKRTTKIEKIRNTLLALGIAESDVISIMKRSKS